MDSLARKGIDNRAHEEIERIKRETVFPGERFNRKKKELGRGVGFILAYTIIFSIAGIVYLSSIITKTKYNIKMEELKKQAAALKIEVHKLKADTDAAVNLNKIEGYARINFGMEITDDIRYVQIK